MRKREKRERERERERKWKRVDKQHVSYSIFYDDILLLIIEAYKRK